MISAGDLRKGTTFEQDGQVYVVVEFLHVKPGKGAAFVRTKLKNAITGAVTETTLTQLQNFKKQLLKEKKCNIYILMENYIISWIKKLLNKFH